MATDAPPVGATEDANKSRLRELLETAGFELYPEVWVREPMRGITARVDFVAVPGDNLHAMPFDLIGVEVKRAPCSAAERRHALGQCIAYRNCILIDRRLPATRGLAMPAVALYAADDSHRDELFTPKNLDDWARYGEVRLAATQNVGLFVHHRRDGLTLELAAEAVWCERRGVTGVGANWPRARRFANGSARRA